MTNSSPWKDPAMFKNGKPSISIRAIEKPWLCNSDNQRVNPIIYPINPHKSPLNHH